ncbi:hypothetical protein BTM25_22970 [Actinomadura rubteroloni]|uniref:Uncharacterized protein n=1 Tax=Actinomadura rubteroloni TaxID=1926885 RepID=A0A2P4US44_9ACTN|nr:hypothetical protein BTM25_22970 [Actinomadura rubteroloni]
MIESIENNVHAHIWLPERYIPHRTQGIVHSHIQEVCMSV